ncbi:MAG: hypothetical protein KatS3mg015_2906 [Fimbriimonadales bacterium]|nr:MAG: hypothetical protein KatS3mg015_2906 [Fimbriimonadales bacterium]
MRRLILIVLAVPLLAWSMTAAWADTPPPPTDGTETYEPGCTAIPEDQGGGEICWDETGFGPPHLIRVESDRCVIVVDPPQWVWITAHVQWADGTVRTDVFPYEYDRPGEIDFDLTPHLDPNGQVTDVWFTWNIGSGESDHTGPIDCTPEPTTTTTMPTTTTTTPTTVPPTQPPTTTVVLAPPTVAALPETGISSLLVWTALGTVAGGVAALIAGRRGR